MPDMVQLARENEDIAVILYDQFREVGNVLSGFIYSYEARALKAGDEDSARVFRQEHEALRDLIDATDPSDVDTQARLMDEWRHIVHDLQAA